MLLTGATGFVGRHLYPRLVASGAEVVCSSRTPDLARAEYPDRQWRLLDTDRPGSIRAALEGCDVVVYLIHSLMDHDNYAWRERTSAEHFAKIAGESSLQRVVYLGGPNPAGGPSRHLRSRMKTGQILRAGSVPTIELRASMIVGFGSASWRMARDLALRAPWFLLPPWASNRSQPVSVDDVVAALAHAASTELSDSVSYALPGPEILSSRAILEKIAALRGIRPIPINVPFMTPAMSSYGVKYVTGLDRRIALELIEAFMVDVISQDEPYWPRMPGYEPTLFEHAARRTLGLESAVLPLRSVIIEAIVRLVTPKVDVV